MLTLQETYDKIVQHLRQLPRQASDGPGSYVYQTHDEDKLRCAVGVLIPDGHPALDFLGPVSGLFAFFPELAKGIAPTKDHKEMLREFQWLHDRSSLWNPTLDPKWGESAFEGMAKKFNLQYSPPGN